MSKVKLPISVVAFVLFLLTGLVLCFSARQPVTPSMVAATVGKNLQKEIAALDQTAATVKTTLPRNIPLHESEYPYFIFENQTLAYWTDHAFVPSYYAISDSFKIKLLKSGSSDYLAVKYSIGENKTLVFAVPLFRKYNITNDYLSPEWNRRIFPATNINILEPAATNGEAVCIERTCPFRISLSPDRFQLHDSRNGWAGLCLMTALAFLLMILYQQVEKINYAEIGFAVLFAVLFVLRYGMIKWNFPSVFFSSDLFNPLVFASSSLNASLGDLVLNELAILMVCVYLFKNYPRLYAIRLMHTRRVVLWLLSVVSALGILFAMLYPFVVVQTLFNNSTIDLDISQSLHFDSLRLIALLAIVVSAISSFLFAHAFVRLLVGDRNTVRILISVLLSIGAFVLINRYTGQVYKSSLIAGVMYFLVIYVLKFYGSLSRLNFVSFAYFFVSVFFMSANTAYGVHHFSRLARISSQFKFANDFLIDRDIFGEYLLQETADKISNDVFIQTRIASPFLNRDAIRQKIRQFFLPGYFNKYDVEIFLFSGSGESIDGRSSLTFPELIHFNQDAYRTNYKDVFFVNTPSSTVAQQYVVVIPVKRTEALSGYVVMTLGLKRVIPESVYPELLVDNRTQQAYRYQGLSYALFSRDGILLSSGDFNYDQFNREWLGNTSLHTEGFNAAGYDHVAVEDENDRVAVVSSPEPSRTFVFGNFAFLMVVGLTIILIFILIHGMTNYARGHKLYFSARVQLYLNLAFFLPLMIVSISTLSLISRSSQEHLNEDYLERARSLGDQLSIQLSDFLDHEADNTVSFENRLKEITQLANVDANVYNKSGLLMATSQPLIFENGLLSAYINPSALRRIARGDNAFIRSEHVGELTYFVSYAALRRPSSGEIIGIVGIPFFRSAISLEKVQINIFVNILNIFVLIFIALFILSYFVSQWLTFPLTFITQTLRRTSLTKINQPLVWKADDEIGVMVREYNQMLFNLSESKAELERTQRERAWREIAQQVAHEIKNPLTPMKLTLQQLERAIAAGKNSEEKTSKSIGSLLTQVDTLNEIASSFSSFAKMPEPIIQRLELISLVRRIVDLHTPTGDLTLLVHDKELYVMADEQMLGRTFSNIILNAFQSAIPGKSNRVVVSVERLGAMARVSIEDQGKGIEDSIANRIFVPYFTTKKSGSGLGLAISKQGIEHMKGKIWFETSIGKGTTFFIELPLE